MEIGATVSAGDALLVILLGVLLGTLGQFARTLGEVADPQSSLNARALGINVLTAAVVGATAGGLGAVTFVGEDVSSADLLTMIAAGYVGTDFISQFLKRQFGSLRNP
jgi:hypothetical protein